MWSLKRDYSRLIKGTCYLVFAQLFPPKQKKIWVWRMLCVAMGPDREINVCGLVTEVEPLLGARSGHDRIELDLVVCVVEHTSGRPVSKT